MEGPRIDGLPADEDGFIPVDGHGRVKGVEDVYAAGDGTNFPIKQGGLGLSRPTLLPRTSPIGSAPGRPRSHSGRSSAASC